MPTIPIDGNNITYEIIGSGPNLIWNAGGREPGVGCGGILVEYLAQYFKVLLWDRRNSAGSSDIYLSQTGDPITADANDLHDLIHKLDFAPAMIGGGSVGCGLSLMMAYLYPNEILSILAIKPFSMRKDIINHLNQITWLRLALEARLKGMKGMLEMSTKAYSKVKQGAAEQSDKTLAWLARSIEANPSNHERLLTLNPEKFTFMLEKWGSLSKNAQTFVGLTENMIGEIDKPVLIIAGDDPIHPKETSEWLGQKLPHARLSQMSGQNVTNAKDWQDKLFPEIKTFFSKQFLLQGRARQ